MLPWIARLIAALVALVSAGLFAGALRALGLGVRHLAILLGAEAVVAALLALMLVLAVVMLTASPGGRRTARADDTRP